LGGGVDGGVESALPARGEVPLLVELSFFDKLLFGDLGDEGRGLPLRPFAPLGEEGRGLSAPSPLGLSLFAARGEADR
jgi:hypothetical protein